MRRFFALLLAASFGVAHAAPVTDNATLDGVAYRIDIPDEWNHELVVFYHGYATDQVTFPAQLSPMFEPFLQRHYAVLQSAYSQTGWAVEQGYADTEKLRRYFEKKYGKPKRTFVSGMSMGGTLTVMTIENKPDIYAGALSLCGALEPTDRLMQRDFALRAAFDYFFPDLLGPLAPVPADYVPTDEMIAKINHAFAEKPAALHDLLHLYGAADEKNFAPVIAFIGTDTVEMQHRAKGNPFGNANFIYTGTSNDFALNDGVKRYRADPEGRRLCSEVVHADGQAHASIRRTARHRRSARPRIQRLRIRDDRAARRPWREFRAEVRQPRRPLRIQAERNRRGVRRISRLDQHRKTPRSRKARPLNRPACEGAQPAPGARVRGGHRDVILRGQRRT